MKKFMLVTAFIAAALASASGQKLMIGEKAPELKVKEWLGEKPEQGKARLVEFCHTTDANAMERLALLDGYKEKFGGKLTVVLIFSEEAEAVKKAVLSKPRNFSVGIDDGGKTLDSYTQYIPFGVLTDPKGRVVWFGNPRNLKEETISGALK